MSKQALCPICLMDGNIIICPPKDDLFYKCPKCKNEIWPFGDFVKRQRQQDEINTEINNTYRSCSLPARVKVHGGGDSVGKSGKDKMKKKSLSQLNFNLYK